MSLSPRLAYVQTRVQSRYAGRPDVAEWSGLGQAESFGHYLQQARAGGLGPCVEKLGPDSNPHAVEICLREYFRQSTGEISRWMPDPWRPATRWFGLLVDLEPLRLLVTGDALPAWFGDDPFLGVLANDRAAWPLPELAPGGAAPDDLAARWHTTWNRLRPGVTAADRRALAALEKLLPVASYDPSAVNALERSFRRCAGFPAAVFSFLALLLSDLHRLRGELLKRLEFSAGAG